MVERSSCFDNGQAPMGLHDEEEIGEGGMVTAVRQLHAGR